MMAAGADRRQLRQKLEAAHGNAQGDVKLLIDYLGDEDRFNPLTRLASALGESTAEQLARRCREIEKRPKASVSAAIALAHQGKPEDQSLVLERLGRTETSPNWRRDDLLGALACV